MPHILPLPPQGGLGSGIGRKLNSLMLRLSQALNSFLPLLRERAEESGCAAGGWVPQWLNLEVRVSQFPKGQTWTSDRQKSGDRKKPAEKFPFFLQTVCSQIQWWCKFSLGEVLVTKQPGMFICEDVATSYSPPWIYFPFFFLPYFSFPFLNSWNYNSPSNLGL